MNIKAYILTCPKRHAVLQTTLGNLRATDWGEEPTVICDDGPRHGENNQISQARNALDLLKRAADDAPDFTLFLEDDLEFNRHLRHNLLAWAPLRMRYLLLGSLYNPGVMGFAGTGRAVVWAARHFIADPLSAYGSQAFVLSLPLVHRCIAEWYDIVGMQDIKISRIADRLTHAMLYHMPSLVQHQPAASTWGGHGHQAGDFNKEYRT